jgi:Family of unknown function (DUF5681)
MGKFAKGRSGNPGGRPKTIAVLRALVQGETRPTCVLASKRQQSTQVRLATTNEILRAPHGVRRSLQFRTE